MKMKNIRLLEKAIKEDCEIKSNYIDKDGCTCAIGKLALVAGVPRHTLRKAGNAAIDVSSDDEDTPLGKINAVIKIREAIHKKFGLSYDLQGSIQRQNDLYDTPEDRRVAILGFIASQKPW
jgi:hypothetical protein